MATYTTEKTHTELTNYADTNINTNGSNSITGALHNTMLNYIIPGLAGKAFDSTRPYKEGQLVVKNDTTFGYEIWAASSDVAAAAWNASDFTRITKRSEKIRGSLTPYTGIEAGTKTYAHNLGHVDFLVQAFDSSGGNIPLNITAKSTTTITINSSQNYPDAAIYISEMVIS